MQYPVKTIRSFVRRTGRLTAGQEKALTQLSDAWVCPEAEEGTLDLNQLFKRDAPKVMEIGFGNGGSLASMAEQAPELDFLGFEVHTPGVGSLLQEIEKRNLTNVRIVTTDAVAFIQNRLKGAQFYRIQIYFPDPWHKKRHHKRRIIQPAFVQQLEDLLAPEGYLHLATDWEDYAQHMLTVMTQTNNWVNTSRAGDFVPRPDYRPQTKFELRGLRLGHQIFDLIFAKK